MNKEVYELVNKQVNEELHSAYVYLSMSAYFENINLSGFAHWMKLQSKEELDHAMKIYGYLIDRRQLVRLLPISEPKTAWNNSAHVFEEALAHEIKITKDINDIMNVAHNAKDHATSSFFQWFVDEQVEEEAQADEILQKIKMCKDMPGPLLILDHHLSKRK